MPRQLAALSFALVASLVVACSAGNRSSATGSSFVPMTTRALLDNGTFSLTVLPARTIGEELPSEGVGSMYARNWKAEIGGFTQTRYAQVLGFAPGTRITIRNLSKTTPHTLNVIAKIKGAPAKFPANPNLSFAAHGGHIFKLGYASGAINPGKSVTVTLKYPGIYLIGCAFHYKSNGMRDIIVVGPGAKPGAHATPSPKPSPTSSGQPTSSPPPPSPPGGW